MTKRYSWQHLLLNLVLLILAGCGGTQVATSNEPVVLEDPANLPLEIDAETTFNLRASEEVVLVDVREDWEYAEGHIPGSMLISLNNLMDRMDEIPKDKTVITVCRSGNRSKTAAELLLQRGYKDVHSMKGGILAWDQQGYEIEQ